MNVLIIDDHNLFSSGLKYVLKIYYPDARILIANSCHEGLEIAGDCDLDLILLDLFLPDTVNLAGLEQFIVNFPNYPVVIMSAYFEPELIQKAIETGAMGFIGKESSPEEMHAILDHVFKGNIVNPLESLEGKGSKQLVNSPTETVINMILNSFDFTVRQRKVIEMVAKFRSNKEIAQSLGCAEATVKIHVRGAFRAMGVKNRTGFYDLIHGNPNVSI